MDVEQFKQQYLSFHPKLYRIAFALVENKADAEDILQETYGKLWAKRNDLPVIRNPEAFAVTLVKNLCLDFLRSARVRKHQSAAEEIGIATTVSPVTRIEEKEAIEQVKLLISQLPEKQRKVLRLKGWGDCSTEEIAQLTGLSAVNVRALLSRARKTIREQF